MTGKGPGRARGASNGEARVKPKIAQPVLQVGKQTLLTTEEMRSPGNVQEQAVGAAGFVPNRHERRILHGPEGKLAQGLRIGGRIGITHLQIEDLGTGVG